MIELNDSDKTTIIDSACEHFMGAVQFVQRKYGCSQEDAANAVDEVMNRYWHQRTEEPSPSEREFIDAAQALEEQDPERWDGLS